jgi:hypothetical protein
MTLIGRKSIYPRHQYIKSPVLTFCLQGEGRDLPRPKSSAFEGPFYYFRGCHSLTLRNFGLTFTRALTKVNE